MKLEDALKHEAEAARLGVSEVARSRRGFMRAYQAVNGDVERMALRKVPGIDRESTWDKRRDEFVARHSAQYNKEGGRTLRRWLALVMWAYYPGPKPAQKAGGDARRTR